MGEQRLVLKHVLEGGVQQSTKVELFLNLKTAKALGITVPLKLIGRSHDVIE